MEEKSMPTKKPRITLILNDEILDEVEDFRFENRYPNRSAAIVDLLYIGLKEAEKQKEAKSNNSN